MDSYVTGDVAAFNDYPCIGPIPVLSQRAVQVLKDLLGPCGELLPLTSDIGDYFAFNILTKSEALDVENSEAEFAPSTGKETAFSIDHFEFHRDQVGQHAIFRVREMPAYVLVTDAFKTRVDQAGLFGFQFSKLWPLPRGERWEILEMREKRNRDQTLQPLRGQSLTIDLFYDGAESDAEDALINSLVEKISGVLAGHRDSKESSFVGAVEGVEMLEGQDRIWIVCPEAETVARIVLPVLRDINWPGVCGMTLFRGNRYDPNTKVKKVTVE
ncbi:MAG: DUF1629 domain-containing protein [Planctomycetota bacterium]